MGSQGSALSRETPAGGKKLIGNRRDLRQGCSFHLRHLEIFLRREEAGTLREETRGLHCGHTLPSRHSTYGAISSVMCVSTP